MPRSPLRLALVGLLAVQVSASAAYCEWDYDTLLMERTQFPEVHEIIAGDFLRHSPELYEWRIRDRLARLEGDPDNLRLLDDLGVAYGKTGKHAEAIATARRAEAVDPDRYETVANLGTFLIHDGQLEAGLAYIQKAVAINPDAHFGREIIQQYLVEYVIDRKQAEGELRLPLKRSWKESKLHDFDAFLAHKMNPGVEKPRLSDEQRDAGVKGVVGMVRFGNSDSPILMEALGDLLLGDWNTSARRLASRAFLRAAMLTDDPAASKAYRGRAKGALSMQTVAPDTTRELSLEAVERRLAKEVAAADRKKANVFALEREWIAAGKNPDEEFRKRFYEPRMKEKTKEDGS